MKPDDQETESARCQEPSDARSVILSRRARFVALALAAAQAGSACGGKQSEDVCLSYAGGRGGAAHGGSNACLGVPLGGQGGAVASGGSGAVAGQGGTTACLGLPCLSVICLSPPIDEVGGAGGEGGLGGAGGAAQGGDGGTGGVE